MEYKYKLSIIIPAYNTGDYIGRTLNVLTNLRLKNDYEILVVDDNSTDDTKAKVSRYREKSKNLAYFQNHMNLGPGAARNIGLQHSAGEYITFLDSDDWIDLVTYQTAIEALDRRTDCDIAIWGIKNEFDNASSSLIRTDYRCSNVISRDLALEMLCNTLSLDITISSYLGNKLFRRTLLEKHNIRFREILFEDVEFSFRTLSYARGILLLPNIYTHYYQRQHSIIHSFSKKHIEDMFTVFRLIKEEITSNNFDYNYRKCYESLIEKCSKTLFHMLYDCTSDPSVQKGLICYYFEKLFELCELENIIDYLDSERLKKILLGY